MTDLIKREDAIMWFEPYADRGLKIPIETVIQNLKDIPSAENKGEWVKEMHTNIVQIWKCDQCAEMIEQSIQYKYPRWSFCPNCGARMVKK